eukprot:GHVR01091233.1.p1 GENE.GHVR01091233.1~~GHVR01091233.1.p1  ORF type:complete len:156 (-),score=65.87 GHVR01091233.1:36-503(-)
MTPTDILLSGIPPKLSDTTVLIRDQIDSFKKNNDTMNINNNILNFDDIQKNNKNNNKNIYNILSIKDTISAFSDEIKTNDAYTHLNDKFNDLTSLVLTSIASLEEEVTKTRKDNDILKLLLARAGLSTRATESECDGVDSELGLAHTHTHTHTHV